jgi:ankyrin repeat protein
MNGLPEIAHALLAGGADANAKDGNGFTALHSSAVYGHAETVQALLASGADARAKGGGGKTPLYLATMNGHTNIVQLLRNAAQENGTPSQDRPQG